MGAHLSHVSCCVGRDHRENPIKDFDDMEAADGLLAVEHKEQHVPMCSDASVKPGDDVELHNKIDAVISARGRALEISSNGRKSTSNELAVTCSSELKQKPTQAAPLPSIQVEQVASDAPSKAKELKALAKTPAPECVKWNPDAQEFLLPAASPAPEFGKWNPNAKEFVLPAASPAPECGKWNPNAKEFVPPAALERKIPMDAPATSCGKWNPNAQVFIPGQPKVSEIPTPCNVQRIPSPVRIRTKRTPWADASDDEKQQAPLGIKLINLENYYDPVIAITEKTEPRKARKAADEVEDKSEAEKLQELQEMAEMDKQCVAAFLECVRTRSWREGGVYTPIKGTNLYIKYMRPCRPAGTSVDVKDSSFKNLRSFLQFLEMEGLLRLQPGLSDPVVTEINFKACKNYKFKPPSHGDCEVI